MADPLPPIPPPLDPSVQRTDAQGRPTPAIVEYETKLNRALAAMKDKLDTL